MNKLFKFTILSLIVIMVLTACGNSTDNNKEVKSNTKAKVEETQKVEKNAIAPKKDQAKSSSSDVMYKDGTYKGTAKAYDGDITVEVTISNGKISDVKIVESVDDEEYLSSAKKIIPTIIASQSTDVDVASGATYSSKGIINAVSTALESAKNK